MTQDITITCAIFLNNSTRTKELKNFYNNNLKKSLKLYKLLEVCYENGKILFCFTEFSDKFLAILVKFDFPDNNKFSRFSNDVVIMNMFQL